MKSKTVERLMDTTPQHIKDQVDLFADNLVKNQTPIEWLQEQIFNRDWKNMSGEDKLKLFEQAKQMEQDQLSIKYGEGYHEGLFDKENK